MERGRGTRGGPEWSQTGQDLSGARQYRTRGHGGRIRGGPKEQADAAVIEGTPDGARGAGQGSSAEWPSLTQLQQFQSERASQPVMRGWDRAHKCLLASQVKSKGLVCILGRGICNILRHLVF